MPTTPRLHPRRSSTTTLAAAAVLGLALPGLALAASPSPSAAPDASPAPSAPASAAPGASPTPRVAIRYGTLPAEGGPVEPGTYQDWSLGATLGFDVGEGWVATPIDAGFGLALAWADQLAPAVLTFSTFDGLVFENPCDPAPDRTLTVDTTPEGLAGDLAQSPDLVVGPPTDVTIAGQAAVRLELGTQQPMQCPRSATWIWANEGGGGFVLEDGEQATLVMVPLEDSVLVISWESYPGVDFEAFTQAAEAIVDTLTIGPAPTASPLPVGDTGPAAPVILPPSPLPGESPAPDSGPVA